MNDPVDLLQIKIDKARADLPEDTVKAIDAVDWKAAILSIKEKKRYTLEQLGDLDLETELLLAGLMSPQDYPRELQNRMQISKAEANELVSEMNELVFKKIREELIKNTERKSAAPKIEPGPKIESREDMLKMLERPELAAGHEEVPSILVQKLSAPVQTPTVKTEHALDNITKTAPPSVPYPKGVDPYRLPPE